MPSGLQAKLLTAIESKRVRPLGTIANVAVDIRIVSATNTDLEKAIAEGRFRAGPLLQAFGSEPTYPTLT